MLIRLLLFFCLALGSAARAAEPLDPEVAYRFSARLLDEKTIEARWDVLPEYYLYKGKIAFAADGVKLGAPVLPTGQEKDDEFFGRVEILRGTVIARIPLVAGAPPFVLKAESQGCWDGGVCYPPLTQTASIAAVSSSGAAEAPAPLKVGADGTASAGDESGEIAKLLKGASFWVALITFFGFGLLLSLTPCVFPMIPILSGIIVNHGHAVTHARAFMLSLAYVLGMAVTYAAVGVAAGFSGTLLSNALQNAWVLSAFALVFVALALSMFGFYELQLPAALQSKLSDTANRQGGSLPAIAVM
ncbi:MAG: protein-disulfide reductase DsbD family protein, partial [Rhodocyclaceae bacterium]|nr:protein-disulfide reductase DsbD family protein [Rhodocyclaceae bacterium]